MRSFSLRRQAALLSPLMLAGAFFAQAAQAIVFGTNSSLHTHVVRVASSFGAFCSGTVIDRLHVVTAGHCSAVGVVIEGRYIAAMSRTQTSKLADGRVISVHGDAAILNFRQPLPASVTPIPIGVQGTDGEFVIAGFGASSEGYGGLGQLRQASVVVHVPFKLVDPQRGAKNLSASACFGDSGGAVLRNGALVGIITRASHPHPAIACGHLTHYAPVVSTPYIEPLPTDGVEVSAAPRNPQRRLMVPRGVMPR